MRGRSDNDDQRMVAVACGDAWRGVWCGADLSCGCIRQVQDWRLKAVFVIGFSKTVARGKDTEEEHG